MRIMVLCILLCSVLLSGCQSLSFQRPNYSLFKSEQEERTDALWRQGSGFNNPNVDRIRDGQTPLNFNGKPDNFQSAAEDIAGRAIGYALVFGIFEAVPTMFRGFANKLRRE